MRLGDQRDHLGLSLEALLQLPQAGVCLKVSQDNDSRSNSEIPRPQALQNL